MIEEDVPMDKRHDEFYERLMEQRIQKLNNPEQPSMEDSHPLPIEPLRTAPVTLPQKRVSITSSDSGVNSPHVLSPAMPITPRNLQPYLVPSTSRTNPRSVPVTPIQLFINNIRKSKAKEPKYNRSKPGYPDPSLSFEPALDKAIDSKSSSFIYLLWSSVLWNSPTLY